MASVGESLVQVPKFGRAEMPAERQSVRIDQRCSQCALYSSCWESRPTAPGSISAVPRVRCQPIKSIGWMRRGPATYEGKSVQY
jgi:hypothetical protein